MKKNTRGDVKIVKRTYRKYFYAFYGAAFVATCTPAVNIANRAELWFGLPALPAYLLGWSLLVVAVLAINMKVDTTYEKQYRRKKNEVEREA